MAVMLENISTITVIARNTIATVYRAAQIVASMPNLSYRNKARVTLLCVWFSFIILLFVWLLCISAVDQSSFLQAFPEALFHQLLPAMVHPDHETRVGAHQIFSVVLVPSSVHPSTDNSQPKRAMDLSRALTRTVSVFSSSAALFDKLKRDKSLMRKNPYQDKKDNVVNGGQPRNNNNGVLKRLKSSYSRYYSVKNPPLFATDENFENNSIKDQVDVLSRLKSSYNRVYSVKNPPLSTTEGNSENNSKKDQVSLGNVVNISNFFFSKICFLYGYFLMWSTLHCINYHLTFI